MSLSKESIPFRENAAQALRNPSLRAAMRNAVGVFALKRAEAVSDVPLDLWRDQASETRRRVLDHLADYVDQFARSASRAGATVHRAEDAETAVEIVASLLKDHGARKVVKSKSMISEEIHLNDYLETQGLTVVETDLGEFIIQIAMEHPSHIIVPAIHKDRCGVGKLFAEKLGCEYTEDPAALTKVARAKLRREFLSAEAGITGANFAIADSGGIVVFTNEGNGRMCTTLPPVHIVVTSIEKIIPSVLDLPKFIRLLPRSATGQIVTTYVSVITGVRKAGEATGAKHLHIVLLDNGRSRIAAGEFGEMLKCIRCGACLNACPLYRTLGGHAYGSTYPGPMGIVLTTLLEGMERAHTLLDATTLCGACGDVCPVKVPLPKLLRLLRERRAEEGFTPALERTGMTAFGIAVKSPTLFEAGQKAMRLLWPLVRKIGIRGTLARLPIPAEQPFRRRIP
jgi:L-lactate dehydrogenase complex protein LldF